MGVNYPTEQRSVFLRICSDLLEAEVKFSRRDLKEFVTFLLLHFPETTLRSCGDPLFWGGVCEVVLNLGHQGDFQGFKFASWIYLLKVIQIHSQRRNGKQSFANYYQVSHCLNPYPSFPKMDMLREEGGGSVSVLPHGRPACQRDRTGKFVSLPPRPFVCVSPSPGRNWPFLLEFPSQPWPD